MSGQMKVLLAACILFAAGCVSIPVKTPTKDIRQDELAQDVRFLAQPALKGRKTGSWESQTVRRFLIQRFEQYKLIPWAKCASFEQGFRFGTNVIGMLPGSDPNLANEIILVSAHYDHAGVQKWKVCPGACDNASGVAAMLEIAESLSLSETKPKRTICFASFDAEEMYCLGSFAFTCRDDYDDTKIVAVINMDILGRNLLEAVKNSFLLVGAERYPQFQRQVMDFGKQADLKILPIGNSLVGPVSDHVAFVSSRRPVLFFTSGIYNDYHQPTDTPDKMDFGLLEKETTVVKQAIRLLADSSTFSAENVGDKNDEQIMSLLTILQQIQENQRIFNLDPNNTAQLNKLVTQTQEKASQNPSSLNSVAFQRETITKLLDILKKHNPILAQYSQMYLLVSRYYSMNPQAFTEAYREIIRHYLKNGLPIFGSQKSYWGDTFITDRDWAVSRLQDNQYIFSAIELQVNLQAQLGLLGKKSTTLEMKGEFYCCKGSLDQLSEYIFLQAFIRNPAYVIEHSHIAVPESNLKTDLSKIGNSKEKAQQWLDILSKFEKQYPDPNSNSLIPKDLQWQKAELKDWLLKSIKSGNKDIAGTAISIAPRALGELAEKELRQMLIHSSVNIAICQSALYALAETNKKENLLFITDMLDDKTPCPIEKIEMLEKDCPLKEHPLITETKPEYKEWYDKQKPKTLGQIARESLKKVTKKDFGTDKQAWQEWIKKHY